MDVLKLNVTKTDIMRSLERILEIEPDNELISGDDLEMLCPICRSARRHFRGAEVMTDTGCYALTVTLDDGTRKHFINDNAPNANRHYWFLKKFNLYANRSRKGEAKGLRLPRPCVIEYVFMRMVPDYGTDRHERNRRIYKQLLSKGLLR